MGRRATVDIVILGGSYAGLSVAHQFLRKTTDELRSTSTAPRYRIVLVAPNTHLYWNVGAPRALCNDEADSPENYFVPFLDAFSLYEKGSFHFIQGEATAVDFGPKTVEIRPILSENSSGPGPSGSLMIDYHALVIATGSTSDCPLLSLYGDHERTLEDIKRFRTELSSATSCVIIGGGPSGVECAGQLATWVNRTQKHMNPRWRDKLHHVQQHGKRASGDSGSLDIDDKDALGSETIQTLEPLKVTLISGGPRLLGKMKAANGHKAERMLKRLGVRVIHGIRLLTAQQLPSRITRCILSQDLTISCDLFIAATGTTPNTQFVSKQFLDAGGYIVIDQQSLRVPRAGERVFAIGTCAAIDSKSLLDVFNCVPVLLQNLKNDLLEWEIKMQYPHGGYEDRILALKDIWLDQHFRVTQLCPISPYGGVGLLKGQNLPSLLVWLMKGRNYNVRRALKVTELGERPYPIR